MDNTNFNTKRKEDHKSGSIDAEVSNLFKRSDGRINQADFHTLRVKYGNNTFVEKIEQEFLRQYTDITKKARKFAQLIRKKYADEKEPFHSLLEKAYKYKVKHNLTNEVFSAFQRIYEDELVGLSGSDIIVPSTNVQKVLGKIDVDYQGFTEKLSDNDFRVLNDIMKLHASSKALHAQVILQSIKYEDCGIEALTGTYDRNIHNAANHVHPVVAALFLPKINILETHFLHSNIANIVKVRYNKDPFSSMADALLYSALCRDPNDVVCDPKSTITDLHNRAQLQNQLWNAVLSLRNGQYYNSSSREFITSIDTCRMNRYDSPDLIYGRYDATILKRMLSAFSFNPTIVTASPVYQMINTNPYQQNLKPQVTFVPMINLKIPYSINDNSPIDLQSALEQTQLLVENGIVVPKFTSLIYSRGVLFFYIDRRANIIYNTQSDPIFAYPKLPTAVAGFEKINQRPINFDHVINIRNDQYRLRSVILSEVNQVGLDLDIVTGSSAIFVMPEDLTKNIIVPEYIMYDPTSVVNPVVTATGSPPVRFQPIQKIYELGRTKDELGFNEFARTRGIIFTYQLVRDASVGNIIY